MIELKDIFEIKKGDVVSIVGSGGKTTLLHCLAKELKNEFKVLVSTSSKMFMPSNDNYDYLYSNLHIYLNSELQINNGITIISKCYNSETNKLIGIDNIDLNVLIKDFEIILLEADGSRNLPIKGWKNHEPPVLNMTNKTIGIIPINCINKKASREFIYGFEEFNIITDNSEYINFEAIGKICSNKDGIFKNSKGNLYLFLNKADTEDEIYISKELSKYLKEYVVNKPFDFKICIGSLETGEYYEC